MKARKRAGTVGKVLGCALLLVIALFPIYWLVAMAIRPTSEMQGHISLMKGSGGCCGPCLISVPPIRHRRSF